MTPIEALKLIAANCSLDENARTMAQIAREALAQAEQSTIPDDLQTAVSRGLRLAGFSFTVDTMLTVAREVHGLLEQMRHPELTLDLRGKLLSGWGTQAGESHVLDAIRAQLPDVKVLT